MKGNGNVIVGAIVGIATVYAISKYCNGSTACSFLATANDTTRVGAVMAAAALPAYFIGGGWAAILAMGGTTVLAVRQIGQGL